VEKTLGPEHLHIATSLNNLAKLYVQQGKDYEAELLLHRALGIRVKALGQSHPLTVQSLKNYTVLLRKIVNEAKTKRLKARI